MIKTLIFLGCICVVLSLTCNIMVFLLDLYCGTASVKLSKKDMVARFLPIATGVAYSILLLVIQAI